MPRKDNYNKLSNRQLNLLFAVVKEYCEFGNSVSSQVLKEKYGFNISPATIRNEFSKLRDMGFLYQPFTNSSSQPTEIAFKLFINQMIAGLQSTNKNQQELKKQIQSLQSKQADMQKEITKLLALETKSVGFAVNINQENIAGIKNLISEQTDGQITDILDFLENLDKHKQLLLSGSHVQEKDKNQKSALSTLFGSDNPILPLGKGYAMMATKAKVNNEETVFGIITQPHVLGRKKTLQILNTLNQILNEDEIKKEE
jgi:transcriptional regulator of heat shock response